MNSAKKYNHKKIEDKWKKHWYENNIYKAKDFSTKPKKYILAELPYPSGKSLHVGHMLRYTVPEIYSRFLRMRGYNVLFPMGWDAFGLPAETYAKKTGITPQEAIKQASKDYKESMKDMGYGIDWDREINTSDPDYYKWTQWTFKKLWEEGFAVQKEMPVWWCEELGVLADEEVLPDPENPDGKISERGKHKVQRKMFKQWVLDIPAYAERLIEGLDKVDYENDVKQGQLNWIGKKEGAMINFDIDGNKVPVFTTRPDTIFGVTFLAISPQHDLIDDLIKGVDNKDEVNEYIKRSKNLSDMERKTKEKTGVLLKGINAKHPLNNKDSIPVFLADYILLDYGTGAVMGVPGHDERDEEFANKYNLKIIKVIDEDGNMINSPDYNGMSCDNFYNKIIDKLKQEGLGEKAKMYKLRPQVFSRQRYWGEPIPLIYKGDGTIEALSDEDLPLELPYMTDFLSGDGTSPLEKNENWVNTTDSDGNPARRETDTMPTWAGSNWYYLRYIDPNNNITLADKKKADYWLPVDMYFGDAGHTTAHLLYSRFWFKFLYDIGVVPMDEPYMYRMSGGMLLGPDGRKMSKSRGNVIIPQEVLDEYGADAVRTYLAFIGPYDETYPWNPRGLVACAKLVRDIYKLKDKVEEAYKDSDKTITMINQMIRNMTGMMDSLKMNTAVSEIMIFVNHIKKEEMISNNTWTKLLRSVAPFMPFIAEELWFEINGFKDWDDAKSIHLQDWPDYDEELAKEDNIELPIQINGKLRETIKVQRDLSEDEIKDIVLEDSTIKERLANKDIKKFIYIKNEIVNIVT